MVKVKVKAELPERWAEKRPEMIGRDLVQPLIVSVQIP
jgi:hypothetical protein